MNCGNREKIRIICVHCNSNFISTRLRIIIRKMNNLNRRLFNFYFSEIQEELSDDDCYRPT